MHRPRLSEKKSGGVTVPLLRIERRALMIAARQLKQRISAIPLKMQWQHLKLPILVFGCGNPLAIASLKRGQVVLDLGFRGLVSIAFLPRVLSEKPEG